VLHQPLVEIVVEGQVGLYVRKELSTGEILTIAGQAGVHRVPHAMDNPCIWEKLCGQPKVDEIRRHLVNYDFCAFA
jgi:hypothetical protein